MAAPQLRTVLVRLETLLDEVEAVARRGEEVLREGDLGGGALLGRVGVADGVAQAVDLEDALAEEGARVRRC